MISANILFKVGPEVAIIERPLWDADLPERYFSAQDWMKNDV